MYTIEFDLSMTPMEAGTLRTINLPRIIQGYISQIDIIPMFAIVGAAPGYCRMDINKGNLGDGRSIICQAAFHSDVDLCPNMIQIYPNCNFEGDKLYIYTIDGGCSTLSYKIRIIFQEGNPYE